MNREIKFRAWDGSQIIYRGLYDRNWYTDEKGGKVVRPIHPRDINDLKVMEYTGLTDKNGKEIYEGDILKFKDHVNTWKSNVYEYKGSLLVKVEGLDYNATCLSFVDDDTIFKIIGNIYQNLLE